MKIKIKETSWGINRATGKFRKRVTAKARFPCVVGALPPFGKSGRCFTVESVGENTVCVSVKCAEPAFGKTVTVTKGCESMYRPRSCDGGYYYTFKLVRG